MCLEVMRKTGESRGLLYALLYGVLGLAAMYAMTSGGMGVSVDSERYLIAANHLKEMEVERTIKAIFPHFPVFYPMMVAVVQFLGRDEGVDAARIVSVLSFAVSLIVIFFLGLRIQGKPTAHLSAISFLILAPLIYTFSYCWSETVYIVLSLLFMFMLIRFLNAPERRESTYLVGSGVFAGLGFLTRYVGLSLVGTGLLIILLLSRQGRISRSIKQALVFGLVSVLPMFIYVLLDFLSLGTLKRESVPAVFSLPEQLVRFLVTIYHDLLSFDLAFDKYLFFFNGINPVNKLSSPFFWFSIIILLCLLLFIVLFVRVTLSSRSFRRSLGPKKVLALYVALYSLLLVGTTASVRVDPLGSRFTTPLYPFITLLVFSVVFDICRAFKGRRMKRVLLDLAILATCLFWGIQSISTASIYRGISLGSFPAMEHPGNHNRASLQFLQSSLSSNDHVITNVPYKLSFIWPRDLPYWSISQLDQFLSQMGDRLSETPVYLLLCTGDRAVDPLVVTLHKNGSKLSYPLHLVPENDQRDIIEAELTGRELPYRRIDFGLDYVYELGLDQGIQKE